VQWLRTTVVEVMLAGSMIMIWYHCRFRCEMHGTPL